MELFGRESEKIMKSFFVDLLLLFLFLFGKSEDLVFRGLFDKLDFRVVPIGNILFMECLTIEDSIDILEHSLKVFIGH